MITKFLLYKKFIIKYFLCNKKIPIFALSNCIVKMKDNKREFRAYDIHFAGLKDGKHLFEYHIDNHFFNLFDYHEFNDVNQEVTIHLDKKSTLLELNFFSKGTVNVNCDITDEPFDLPTEGQLHLVIKFGESYNDDNEELLILPQGEHTVNIAQYIYEMIILSVPAKRVNPNARDFSKALETLESLSPKETEIAADDSQIDPRWDELRKLLNK